MFRDLRRMSGAVWPLGMVAVYTIALSRQNHGSSSGELRNWLANAPLALLPWGASLGISIYLFGTEGRNLDLLRAAPLKSRSIFFAKAFAAFVPVLVATELATVVVMLARNSPHEITFGMIAIVAWASIGYVLIDSSASALAPVFDADQVQRSTSLAGRIFEIFVGGTFGLFSALAIGRLIIFSTTPPGALENALNWHVVGVSPLGWPLVVISLLIATAVVAAAVTTASKSIGRWIHEGF
jgi:hypothetical protein